MVLITLFIFGLTLPGAANGIHYYLTPDFQKLKEIGVWVDAATQIFFSLSVSCGGLITLSSYNKFNNNCHRDAIIISVINSGTSFFAGFVIFAILGFMAEKTGKGIDEIVSSGSALAFIAYPEAVLHMPVPPIWAFLFFFMLLTLGMDSMLAYVETITTTIIDHFSLYDKKHYVAIGTCTVMFLCGIPMCCNAGYYLFDLMDNISLSWNVLCCAFIESMVVAWIYGVEKVFGNIKEMGMKIPLVLEWYWKICWCFITPGLVLFLLIMNFINHKPYSFENYVYPEGVQLFAWIVPSVCVLLIPVFGFTHILMKYRKQLDFRAHCNEMINSLVRPTSNWGRNASTLFKENIDAKSNHSESCGVCNILSSN